MARHSRLHEEEAKLDELSRKKLRNPYHEKARPAAPQKSGALAAKPAKKKPAKAAIDITHRMEALRAAITDRYPHNDVRMLPEGLEVAVPGGVITIESAKVAKCVNDADLRAYIDAIPVL